MRLAAYLLGVLAYCSTAVGAAAQTSVSPECLAAERRFSDLTTQEKLELATVAERRGWCGKLFAATGDRLLNKWLEQDVLKPLQDFFQVSPHVVYFHDARAPNGWAIAREIDRGARDVVAIELGYLQTKVAQLKMSAVILMAHEFGHVRQFEERRQRRWPHWFHDVELHADFLAGYFLAQFKRIYPQTSLAGVVTAVSRMAWPSAAGKIKSDLRWGHGSAELRVLSFEGGYNRGLVGDDIATAVRAGYDQVKSLKGARS